MPHISPDLGHPAASSTRVVIFQRANSGSNSASVRNPTHGYAPDRKTSPRAKRRATSEKDSRHARNLGTVHRRRGELPGPPHTASAAVPISHDTDSHSSLITRAGIEHSGESVQAHGPASDGKRQADPAQGGQTPKSQMLRSELQSGMEVHCLNAGIARREQFEIGDIACRRQSPTDIESYRLQVHPSPHSPRPALPPNRKRATQIAEHCLESCPPARRALPGRDDDVNGFERGQADPQLLDHRR